MLMALSLSLNQLWNFNAGAMISGIVKGEKYLAVSSWDGCLYFLTINGTLEGKECFGSDVEDVDYSNGTFAAVTLEGNLFFINETSLKVYERVEVGPEYSFSVKLTPNGTLVCFEGCKYLSRDGKVLWEIPLGQVARKPAFARGYFYVPTWGGQLYIVKDGRVVSKLSYSNRVWATAICGRTLAVSTDNSVYLYRLKGPTEVALTSEIGGFGEAWAVAFSSDCKLVGIADGCSKLLVIASPTDKVILREPFDEGIASLTFVKDNVLVVGSTLGNVTAFELVSK